MSKTFKIAGGIMNSALKVVKAGAIFTGVAATVAIGAAIVMDLTKKSK